MKRLSSREQEQRGLIFGCWRKNKIDSGEAKKIRHEEEDEHVGSKLVSDSFFVWMLGEFGVDIQFKTSLKAIDYLTRLLCLFAVGRVRFPALSSTPQSNADAPRA